jgi:hypothetical protein
MQWEALEDFHLQGLQKVLELFRSKPSANSVHSPEVLEELGEHSKLLQMALVEDSQDLEMFHSMQLEALVDCHSREELEEDWCHFLLLAQQEKEAPAVSTL